jgi:hypothetical protein
VKEVISNVTDIVAVGGGRFDVFWFEARDGTSWLAASARLFGTCL